jgi:UDP-N-acetylglucosamine--N-acetylmuramyl-(pentapeptide) pyrophosphoryl-undecaprenol N-acetylglucosamine transferase
MPEALAASDLVLGRAGASTLAEITAVGRASVLMPYPFHKDRHQLLNARCLARVSAARILQDRIDPALNAAGLREVLEHLMTDDALRESMAASARRIGRGNAATRVAERLLQWSELHGAGEPVESVEAFC